LRRSCVDAHAARTLASRVLGVATMQSLSRVAACVITLAACGAPPAAQAPITPAPHLFDLRSSFWLDLHQRLYAESSDPHARQHAPAQDGAARFTPAERAT
jgi:hypothetical protein